MNIIIDLLSCTMMSVMSACIHLGSLSLDVTDTDINVETCQKDFAPKLVEKLNNDPRRPEGFHAVVKCRLPTEKEKKNQGIIDNGSNQKETGTLRQQ